MRKGESMHSIAELKQKAVDMLFDLDVDTGDPEKVQVYLNMVNITHYWDNSYTEFLQSAMQFMLDGKKEETEGYNG